MHIFKFFRWSLEQRKANSCWLGYNCQSLAVVVRTHKVCQLYIFQEVLVSWPPDTTRHLLTGGGCSLSRANNLKKSRANNYKQEESNNKWANWRPRLTGNSGLDFIATLSLVEIFVLQARCAGRVICASSHGFLRLCKGSGATITNGGCATVKTNNSSNSIFRLMIEMPKRPTNDMAQTILTPTVKHARKLFRTMAFQFIVRLSCSVYVVCVCVRVYWYAWSRDPTPHDFVFGIVQQSNVLWSYVGRSSKPVYQQQYLVLHSLTTTHYSLPWNPPPSIFYFLLCLTKNEKVLSSFLSWRTSIHMELNKS